MTPAAAAKKRRKFDPQAFLSTIDGGRTISSFVKKQLWRNAVARQVGCCLHAIHRCRTQGTEFNLSI